jgi:hypothetical protein
MRKIRSGRAAVEFGTVWNSRPQIELTMRQALWELRMPHYFFDVKNGHRLIDPAGPDCRDDQEAKDQAIIIARQIAADAPETSGGRKIAVLNSQREEIGKVPVHQPRTG